MSSSPLTAVGPQWNRRPVLVFAGAFDTRIKTGEDYDTRSLASLFTMEPENKPKGEGWAFVPSSYHDFDGREHAVQRAKGEYVALCLDIDKGDLPLTRIESLVRGFAQNCAWLIYSSAHSRPGDKRWRVVLPLDASVPFGDWHDAQNALFNFMEVGGVPVDRALDRAAQPVYLPNVPEIHTKSGEALRDGRGDPIFYERATTGSNAPGLRIDRGALGSGIDAIRRKRAEDDRAREAMRRDAEARKAQRPKSTGEGVSIMEEFNRSNSIANLLELYGYTQSARHSEDWKSSYQEGDSYATRIMGDAWVSLSMSDASAGVGARCKSGCFGDAYDLYVHYEHKGDHKAAHRQLHAERKAGMPQPERYSYTSAEEQEFDPETGDPIMDMPDYGDEEGQTEPLSDPAPSEVLDVVDAFDFNEADIPTRPWVIPGVMLSGYTHMLAAPGGSGKSLFTLQIAIALALGAPWGTFAPRRKARTLIINVEDDLHEQRRRLSAAQRVMETGKDDLRGMIHLVRETESIVVAGFDDDRRRMVAKPIVPVLVDYIRRHEIDVLIVDPFTETFEGDENDNSEVKWAMRIWRDEIAKATGCVVYLVHHTTKYAANGAGDANVVRGAGAIVNSTRISATLMPMTEDEAGAIGIDAADRNLYVRYDDAKANQSLKSGKARWFRKETVTLCNGDEDHPADEVGALIPWSPPGMLDGVTLHAINTVLDRIDGGLIDGSGVPTGVRYTADTRGGSKESGRWVGSLLITMLGMKEAGAKSLIKSWVKNGVLVEKLYDDPARRKEITGLFAPRNSRPGEVN